MILLTGATGFVGQRLIEKLAKHGKVKCLARDEAKADELRKKGHEAAVWDLGKDAPVQSVQDALKGVDVVVHAAAQMRGTKNDYRRVNVEGTKRLLEACRKEGTKQIIFLSTILAADCYNNDYGNSKRECERLIMDSGIGYTIFRMGNIYASDDMRTFAKIAGMVRKMPILFVFGKGDVNMQFVNADDVTDAIAAAVGNKKAINRTYYLVGQPAGYEDFLRMIAGRLKRKRLIVHIPMIASRLAFSIYQKTIGSFIRLPVHPDTLLISSVFATTEAEKDLGFNKSKTETMVQLLKPD